MGPSDASALPPRSTQYNRELLSGPGTPTSIATAARLNPVIGRLRRELARVRRVTGAYVGPDGTPFGARPQLGTQASWSVLWREWAISDLGDAVARMERAYLINRGDVMRYRLFLGDAGQHMLAVRPDAPNGPFRYQKLTYNSELAELFSIYARLVFTPPV